MKVGKGIAIVGGIVLLAGAVWAALPLLVDKQVNEALPETVSEPTTDTTSSLQGTPVAVPANTQATDSTQTLAEGTFSGFDAVHQAAGTARLLEVSGKQYVRFESDFTVTNGPDLYVYFGKNGKYVAEANLGKLKGNQGSQNYEVPAGINPAEYNEVWVWCRAFSVPFGKATLQ